MLDCSFDEVTAFAFAKQKNVDAKYSYTAHMLTFTGKLCGISIT